MHYLVLGTVFQDNSSAYMLKCNISSEVNHLGEGIKLGLQDDREKNSEQLGRWETATSKGCRCEGNGGARSRAGGHVSPIW